MAGFFDKVVVGINEGYSKAKEGSKFLVEKAKLNNQIKETEQQKGEVLKSLGSLIYNMHLSGAIKIEQCTEMCNQIYNFDRTIGDMQNQLQALETPKQPQNTPVYTNQPYTQQNVPQNAPQNAAVCSCGFVNAEGSKFCARCGNSLQ